MSQVQVLSPPRSVAMADGWFDLSPPDHFWMQWRFEALARHAADLPPTSEPVLEIGCGHGVFRQQLEAQLGYSVDGCDLNITALRMAAPGRGRLLVYDINDRAPELLAHYAGVFLMDVIEHVDDDEGFLRSAAAHVTPGGTIVLNVPAHEWAYSKYDRQVGHVRRYSRRSLNALIRGAGLHLVSMDYWGLSLLPLVVARQLLAIGWGSEHVIRRGFVPPGRATHRLLKWLKTTEMRLLRAPMSGTSLMAIARVQSVPLRAA